MGFILYDIRFIHFIRTYNTFFIPYRITRFNPDIDVDISIVLIYNYF